MSYVTIHMDNLLHSLKRWIHENRHAIDTISVRSGGWEHWLNSQFAYWLGAGFNAPGLDVQSEVESINTLNGAVSIFENFRERADLVFNGLTGSVQGEPPVIVVETKCQTPKRKRAAFLSDLRRDRVKLEGINAELRMMNSGRVYGLSLGICFGGMPTVPGYTQEHITNNIALQWQVVDPCPDPDHDEEWDSDDDPDPWSEN
ncbi:hypothetical protein [Actinophytocola oryzae]|uniref:Uncharacterized protein n=1 Tax=Actinophytocola oryzae TaxID=502181 RepID=A0A4R7W1K7_9PSEU|nr:hypothetical protein [Actinophytocola oryzae]TDV56292.1 hypothetical protein CLV71_102358 [Actinophytocola oryzae]